MTSTFNWRERRKERENWKLMEGRDKKEEDVGGLEGGRNMRCKSRGHRGGGE